MEITDNNLIRVATVKRFNRKGDLLGTWCNPVSDFGMLGDEMADVNSVDDGDKWELQVVEMTQDQLDNVGDFEGY
jgi:hypothetical protein